MPFIPLFAQEELALQHGRPDQDVAIGSWTDEADGTTDIYQSIDEETANDADYIKSSNLEAGSDTCEIGLANLDDPEQSGNHVVRYRYRKQGDDAMDLTVALFEGATQRASWTHNGVGTDWSDAQQTLSGAEADAITDYTDLRIKFTATAV